MRLLPSIALLAMIASLLSDCRQSDELEVSLAIARWNCPEFEKFQGFFVAPVGQATGLRVECPDGELRTVSREAIPICRREGYQEVLRHGTPSSRRATTIQMSVSFLPACAADTQKTSSPHATSELDVEVGDGGWYVTAERPLKIH